MKFGAFAITLLLVGCASINHSESKPLLFNPEVYSNHLDVSVMSNGCTSIDYFYLIVTDDEVTVRQTKPDLCRTAPSIIRLSFDYNFDGKVYRFKNKVRYMNRVQTR
jgi:hypothetical protein